MPKRRNRASDQSVMAGWIQGERKQLGLTQRQAEGDFGLRQKLTRLENDGIPLRHDTAVRLRWGFLAVRLERLAEGRGELRDIPLPRERLDIDAARDICPELVRRVVSALETLIEVRREPQLVQLLDTLQGDHLSVEPGQSEKINRAVLLFVDVIARKVADRIG